MSQANVELVLACSMRGYRLGLAAAVESMAETCAACAQPSPRMVVLARS
jgi:hypothetical protein